MYLEEIFLDEKFRIQLPNEALKFDGLNQKYKDIMKNTLKNPKIITFSEKPELLIELTSLFEGLETCQKLLNKYLETKRSSFPRFYFLSDNELLSVLGNTNPNGVQEHIVKMYDNVGSLIFVNDSRGNTLVNGMVSCEKEIMPYKSQVMIDGSVEIWMYSVLIEMWRSNKYLIKKSILEYGNTTGSRCEWMMKYQGQMCLAANSVWWTAEVENVFSEIKKVCDEMFC
jgi:dynein heavy chain, axonemal